MKTLRKRLLTHGLAVCCWCLTAGGVAAAAQIGLVLPDETGETASADEAPGARWVELRALGTAGRVVEIWPAGGWQPGQRIPIELLTEGRYLLCFGGEDIATRCGVRDLTSGDSVTLVAAPGIDLVGRFRRGTRGGGVAGNAGAGGAFGPWGVSLAPRSRCVAHGGSSGRDGRVRPRPLSAAIRIR